MLLELELLLLPLINFLKGEAYSCPQVSATEYLTASATTAEATEPSKATEASSAEEVSEATEDVLHGHTSTAEATSARGATADTCMTELVIALALLGIAEYIVCLGKLLELLFSFLVPRVLVWVILYGELTIGLLQLIG